MDQHPIPRQITTFEFKLIGFMTLKQFIYLIVFVPTGYLVATVFPIPILNILLGIVVAGFGALLAFVPIRERPLDIWIKNLFRRLTSPTQYLYQKENIPVYFFKNLYFVTDPHATVAHIETQEKLNEYLTKTQKIDQIQKKQAAGRQRITQVLQNPTPLTIVSKPAVAQVPQTYQTEAQKEPGPPALPQSQPSDQLVVQAVSVRSSLIDKQPVLVGVVKNSKKIPLPGVLIYIKDQTNTPIRLLKTNPHGVFATFSRLNPGEYTVEIKDPKGGFFFDTMKINVGGENSTPLEFYSKELI